MKEKISRISRRKQRQIAQKAAKQKVKELRPFMRKLRDIDLRSDLSPQQIGYINRAFTEYQELTTRPVKIFRTRNKKHLAKAQAYSRHEKGAPKFDVAFIPVVDPKAKVIFKGDRMKIKMGNVTEDVIFFNLVAMAENPQREIERAIAENPDADQFVIMAGKYLFNGGIVRSLVAKKVMDLMAKYANPEENNFWGNWLFGLVGAEYTNQADFDSYRTRYASKLKEIKSQKAAMRRKWQQKYGKKPNG